MSTSKQLNVAVVGATGLVGQQMLKILAQRKFPVGSVSAFASERSVGSRVPFNGEQLTVRRLDEKAFQGIDVAMFAAGADISLLYGPSAAEAGALVIDKRSAWRMRANVPLHAPELSGEATRANKGIIASPNCTPTPLTMVPEPLGKQFGLRRVVVSSYQAASGAS